VPLVHTLSTNVEIYAVLHTNNRRLGAEIYLRYSDRISDLRRSLPTTALFERDVPGNMEMTPEERRAKSSTQYLSFMSLKCMNAPLS
jgi:hypothetical protein